MFSEFKTISSTDKDIQNFSRAVGGVLLILGLLSLFFGGDRFSYFFVGGGALVLLGECAPRVLWPAQYVWMMIGILAGLIMTRVILVFLFYVILTPIALFLRVTGKQFLDTKPKKQSSSYWVPRPSDQKSKESYTQQF